METGAIFIVLACIILIFDFALLLVMKREDKKKHYIAFFASAIACILIVASYFRLTMAFVNDDFSLIEVYTYSSSSLPLWYKVGDPWIGNSGSMLFVTFCFALLYFVYRLTGLERESKLRITTYKIMDIFLVFLLLVALLKNPFKPLPMNVLDGGGLNPLLQTLWVLVHPPVVFLGYVFVFFAFALTLAGMIRGESERQEIKTSLKRALYAAWLFLALGIALGGWWSYEVLGWGGYWAWDPVETASLLPWFTLTAYFHLPARSRDLSKEFTLLITFCMVIFATALTRGGLLESVHTFGESRIGPVLILFAFCSFLYFLYLAKRVKKPLYAFEIDTSSLYSVSTFVAYWSLMFLLLVCSFWIVRPIVIGFATGSPMAIEEMVQTYNYSCYPFTLAFVAALMGCNLSLKVNRYVMLITAILGIGAVLALLGQPTQTPMANFGLPLLLAAGIAIVYNFTMAIQKRNSLHLWGKTLIHLAIIIILIGVFISAGDAAKEPKGFIKTPNSTINVLDTQIEFGNFTVYTGMGRVYYPGHSIVGPEYSALKMDITIKEAGNVHHRALWMYYYPPADQKGVVSKPLIISSLAGDLYISMQHTESCYNSLFYALMGEEVQPEDFFLKVKRIPLIWLVWLGIIMQAVGMSVLLYAEVRVKGGKE